MRSWIQLARGKTPRQAHVDLEGLKDDELGRKGFSGKVAELYRRNDPTAWTRIEGPLRLWDVDFAKLVPTDQTDPRGTPIVAFRNDDVSIGVTRRSAPMPFAYRNGDGDTLYFVHRGTGSFETEFGPLRYEPGDYVLIPKAVNYRHVPDDADQFALVLESPHEFDFPDYGILGRHAPFDPSVVRIPEPTRYDDGGKTEFELRVKHGGEFTSIFYPFDPMDVEGWKGDLFPLAMNIRDFRPIMSDRLHLPPSVHCHFEAKGVFVLNFLPRPAESEAGVERIPWYHRNADYDEVTFMHGGDLMGKPVPKGRCTWSPQGIHHGLPEIVRQLSRQMGKPGDRIGWQLISIDTEKTLTITAEAAAVDRSQEKKR